MEHEKNFIFEKLPILNRIIGIIFLIIALYSDFEWNEKTN